ncbi:MAG: hypothetical protein CL676_13885 [Bdellovibrionaceae bacterium]|nr:hypothetical protein [Pseudobdellovibrionaceae bacterium]
MPVIDCQSLSDQELVEESLKNSEIFRCIVELYEVRLRKYIFRQTGFSRSEVEDVLQESFIAIYRNLNSFDQNLKLQNWIYRIVHNKAVDCMRKRTTLNRAKDALMGGEADLESFMEALSSANAETQVHTQEELKWLVDKINDLPEESRAVMVLRFWEEKDYEEISDILKIPVGSVGSLINRSRKWLLKELKGRRSER